MGMDSFADIFGGVVRPEGAPALDDDGTGAKFPSLFRLMTVTKLEDGKRRLPCTLTIVCEDGMVKAGLRERTYGLSLWTSCGSIGGVFAALEEKINERPAQWRKLPDKWKAH